jgi:hypothetical protein
MARDMSRVGANKACDEESGIAHSHPGEGKWETDDNRDGGKMGRMGGVADKKDHRKDGGGGEKY